MAGVTNSWIQQYTDQPTPCINDVKGSSSLGSCILWLLLGLAIGSLTSSKKREA